MVIGNLLEPVSNKVTVFWSMMKGLQMATEVPMTTTARRMEGVTGKKQRSRAELNSFYCHNSVMVPKKERSLPPSEVDSATCPKIDAMVADFTLANFPTRLPLCWSHEKYTGTAMLLGYLRAAVIWHVFYGIPSSCIHLECPSPLPLSAPSAFVFLLLAIWTLILLCIHSNKALFLYLAPSIGFLKKATGYSMD
ncbi:hypothetical protein QBC37DRAFT_18179 [Rhypophila decipiens]|uniref:Uncharacterized protein n=1 Tax=Rhypophila decipiens TaxID=261697 RepID=A0AAN6YI55_9PEZI|nr:hypothetical protein QBC37DRAFT_18179 [Rhypophila decipiens]